jgi:hypothetical protein
MTLDKKLVEMLRSKVPNEMARDLCSVQPMDAFNFFDYINACKDAPTEKELIAAGYEPVSSLKLVWVKKIKKDA